MKKCKFELFCLIWELANFILIQMLHFEFPFKISCQNGSRDFKRNFKMQNLHQYEIRELQNYSKRFKFALFGCISIHFLMLLKIESSGVAWWQTRHCWHAGQAQNWRRGKNHFWFKNQWKSTNWMRNLFFCSSRILFDHFLHLQVFVQISFAISWKMKCQQKLEDETK